jgi:hypothetical protein
MKKIFLLLGVGVGIMAGLFLMASKANAMTPTLSVSATGNNEVIMTVYGDAYASVILYYQNQGYNYGTQSQYLGTTNSNGYFSTTINSGTYGILSGSSVYVVVNNQASSSVTWPSGYNYWNGYGNLSLSQTSLTVNVGQSANVTIIGGVTPYTMYPTGTNIFQAVIGGNNLQIAGLNSGYGSVNVCSSGGQVGLGSGCATLFVTVNQVNYYNPPIYNNPVPPVVTFSQNNPTLSIGQSLSISISGGNNYYYGGNYNVAYNSNSNIVSATISGNALNLQGLALGNAAVVVCSSSSNCSALNITVGSSGYMNPGNWVSCASEGQFCSFSGTRSVQYGANGVYVYRTFTGGVTCSNAVFGDPVFGVAKRCSIVLN